MCAYKSIIILKVEYGIFSEKKRNRAASIFRILGLIQFTLGLILVVLGGVGRSYHGDTSRTGAHYYSSAFLVGSFVRKHLISTLCMLL